MKNLKAYFYIFLCIMSCFALGCYTVTSINDLGLIRPHQWFITSMFGIVFLCLGIEELKEN